MIYIIYNGEADGEYGLIHDGAIVVIDSWTETKDISFEQEIYFAYKPEDVVEFDRRTAWARHSDFIAFSSDKKVLEKERDVLTPK